ncbi:MAG: hypothetical protein EAZ35_10445 [Sphingobacteriia bacterium]|nr:MAG: hypothetical protein EAZ35_10445 [Sphingobacteriia bacterium]
MRKFYTILHISFQNAKQSHLIVLFLLIAQSFVGLNGIAQISGTVYRDFNGNGAKNNGAAYNEPGAAGVTVKAYNAAGTVLGTTVSAANGSYSFTVGQVPVATKVRLEFSGWQSADFPAPTGLNNKSSVQFATAPNATADFGINYPGDYIDNLTARVIVPAYGNGDNQVNTGNWYDAKNHDAVYAFDYGSGAAANILSDMGQIGAVWGTTYHKKADKLFYAAFVKRHVSVGPLGLNGIYVTTGAKAVINKNNTANFVNLNAVNPAFNAGTLAGRSFAPGNSDKRNANRDDMTGGNVFTEVGKKGIGGMTISDDGRYLYIINLNDRRLWRVDIGLGGTAPTLASQIVSYNAFPVAEGNSSFRPFAVKYYRGSIYIGGVLDGVKPDNSSVNRAELKAIVLKVDASATPGSATFSSVLDVPLTFNRRANMNTGFGINKNSNYIDPNGTVAAATLSQGSWHPWARTFAELTVTGNAGTAIYPQPMLSSLDFDAADGSMILGITDRTGHQAGNANLGPTSIGNNTLYTANAAGDILKANNTGGTYTNFTLENNGSCGTNSTNGAGNGEGPGGGEFYFTDRYQENQGGALGIGNTANGSNAGTSHEETSTGSIANFPGKELIATAFDPITTWYTGGVRYYANNDGIAKNGKVLYQGQDASVFGKANGLGDLEIITAPAPIEIGNRVWFDANANGIQDADEVGIAGVKVSLLKYIGPGSAHTLISQATTDANGNYIFSSDASRTSTGSEKYGIPEMQPNTDLKIFVNGVSGSSIQTPLVGYDITLTDNGGVDPNADERDNDGTTFSLDGADIGSAISINTGIAGANNHSYDFGFATAGSVGGGGGGGVESKSLGDAIALRFYNKTINSENGPIDYTKLSRPSTTNGNIRSYATGNQLKLKDILPTKVANTNYTSYVSTPNYLVGITNAKDVLAIDFVDKQVTKAVSFGTETLGEVYNHTKAICDRLKGYELIAIQNLTVKGINLVQYNLKNNDGNTEYAMSFIVGTKNGRNSYTIQSNWLNKDYTIDEVMYNIQLWGGSPSLVVEMATDIISRLSAGMPVNQISNTAGLPKVYFTAGKRIDENVSLTVKNTLNATNGYLEIKDRANEQSTTLVTRTVPFTIDANGISNISLPSSDLFESTISLYMNGKLEDEVFMADGAWGVDYNTNTTSVKSFKVTNATANSTLTAKDDFKVFRNAELVGTTPDYLTLYKLLRAGGNGQDLSAFKSLKFTAAGNRPLIITLVKQSVTKWEDQYSLTLPITKESQEYVIGLNEFKSKGINTPIDANDISSIVISMGPTTANQQTEVSLGIGNVSFSKEDIGYIRSLQERTMNIYPNPATDARFNVKFKSDKDYSLTLKVVEAATGKILMTKAVNAVRGENLVPVDMNNNSGQKMYILSLDGATIKYKATKIVAGKN